MYRGEPIGGAAREMTQEEIYKQAQAKIDPNAMNAMNQAPVTGQYNDASHLIHCKLRTLVREQNENQSVISELEHLRQTIETAPELGQFLNRALRTLRLI